MLKCAKTVGGSALVAAALALASIAGVSHAQNVATLQWQVSTDDGATWNGGQVTVPASQSSVKVRYFASWVHPDAYAFAFVTFDAVVQGVNSGGNDRITDVVKPPTFRANQQTLIVQRFGSLLKIDDSRDTQPPAFGNRGVTPGQYAENFANGLFTRGQQVSIFEYALLLDGTPGERVLSSTFISSSSDACHTMGAYTTPAGALAAFRGPHDFCSPNRLLNPSTSLVVVPTPGVLGVAAFAGAMALHRRKRREL